MDLRYFEYGYGDSCRADHILALKDLFARGHQAGGDRKFEGIYHLREVAFGQRCFPSLPHQSHLMNRLFKVPPHSDVEATTMRSDACAVKREAIAEGCGA